MRYGEEYETLLPSERFHGAQGRGDSADELAFDVRDTVMSFRESFAFMRRKSDILKKAVAEGDMKMLDYFERHFGTNVSRMRAEIERRRT